MIRFKNLTKRYESGKGIFDFSFEVEEGEVFGLIGPEHSGKTTALRMLMGLEVPTKGRCAINGKDCVRAAVSIRRGVGYLPGELSLPGGLTARQFLRGQAEMRGLRNLERLFELALRLDLNVDLRMEDMTPEQVQKTGIVCAMLHDPPVLLLDDPFRSLGAGARSVLVDLILGEKERGKIVLLASPTVDAADLTCDRVALLEKGNIIYIGDIEDMRENMSRRYLVQFSDGRAAMQFSSREHFEIKNMQDRNVLLTVSGELKPLLLALAQYPVTSLEPVPLGLEETFVHIYGGAGND